MKFIKWLELREVGTSTGDVAVFSRIALPGPVRRQWPWNEEDPFFKKKRKKLDENSNKG